MQQCNAYKPMFEVLETHLSIKKRGLYIYTIVPEIFVIHVYILRHELF
jgi:hypothetical protein